MSKPRLLICEDDPDTADMLKLFFQSQGYEIFVAHLGQDVLTTCEKMVPDLIIQDIRLPDIDGYEVVKRLRRSHRTRHTPVIFLTEKGARENKIAGLNMGAADYITKPFDIQELRLRVRNILHRTNQEPTTDPITSLPTPAVVKRQLAQLSTHPTWAIVYVHLEGLEQFGEAYGFVAGDDVLRAIVSILNTIVAEEGTPYDFHGHWSRSDFVIITDPDCAHSLATAVQNRLRLAIPQFYPFQDLQGDQVRLPTASGPKLSPLMRVSVGLLRHSDGPFTDARAIVEAAAARAAATG